MLQALGLVGTQAGIILVHTAKALPFTVLILSVFFRKMPAEIFEAAVLDHCSRFQTFWRIALPLALPSIGATGLFAFMLSYSEYMFSMVLSGDAAHASGLGGDGGAGAQHRRLAGACSTRRSSSRSCRRWCWSSSSGASSSKACSAAQSRDRTWQTSATTARHPLKTRPKDARQHVTAGPYSPVLEVDARAARRHFGPGRGRHGRRGDRRHDRGADARHAATIAPTSWPAPIARWATSSRSTSISPISAIGRASTRSMKR